MIKIDNICGATFELNYIHIKRLYYIYKKIYKFKFYKELNLANL